MREDFIHYLWKFKKLSGLQLRTTKDQLVVIKTLGHHNHHSGPDFFNAQVEIDGQLWAGNVEMHVKSSDWYKHGHDDDPAYDNVILHVVWKHDAEITRRSEIDIPVLEVSTYVPDDAILTYTKLFAYKNDQFINCEKLIHQVDSFQVDMWLEKVYIQRLEQRYRRIEKSLKQNNNDWEATFFQMLARSFGTKVNADAFEQIATAMDQSVVRKLAADAFQLESVLMGLSGLLDTPREDRYFSLLEKEFAFAKAKFRLKPIPTDLKFFRLRPANYPTIRLSQLAMLYHRNPMLLAQVILAKSKAEISALFDVKAAKYWDTHHVFDKQTESREKVLTQSFIDLLIINCIVPIKFAYARHHGKDTTDELLGIIRDIPMEKNTVTQGFKKLIGIKTALESQAVLQLKPNYCDLNLCLKCDIGVRLMSGQ
ncbi:hypothetical protein AAU57_14605 [Nonlabens sp. YIK11]|uniref:DUF2851 family protein n=1 Tax=Nonlabens sp. YIK11 TaxID=1453349 RepID=UPI0006DC8AC7|nr:DUF2851 family protein [Nonlabens sp. YIK11]KQC31887.1 hypothetical protein AAU57_00030 [Nonlabens sp. YIK11]KQC34430.1 hypothetical protein AAU57_14605 [Nonlabens sp. YIK11]